MISEIANIFKNQFIDVNKAVIDGYVPSEGTYIIVRPDENGDLKEFSRVDIEINKKTKEVDRTVEMFNEICLMDYNSRLIDMNKPVDSKKIIHSNNFLSLFVKKESLENGKLTKEIIDNYYNILENPLSKYEKKPKARELYLEVLDSIGDVDKVKLSNIKLWINENVFNLGVDTSKKNYLKIFFLYDEEDYKREGYRYVIPNIYNSNDFNIKTSNGIVGMPNDNLGLNAKKPYLENKSRKVKIPYLIEQDDVILHKQLFDYFYNLASQGIYNLYIGSEIKPLKDGEVLEEDFNGYYLRIKKGKETEIHDFDVIPYYSQKLLPKFEFVNVLGANYETLYKNNKDNKFQYGTKHTLKEIQTLINEVMFSNYLITNYFSEEVSIKDSNIKTAVLSSRKKLHGWFYKGSSNEIWPLLNKISKKLLLGSIEKGYLIKAMNQFNLRYSLENYFNKGEGEMANLILDIKNNLREKVFENIEASIESDNEFSYAVGQISNYFMSKHKGKNKPLSLVNPILTCKNEEKLKDRLRVLFKKYNYDIDGIKDVRFKRLYSLIISYKVENTINEDMIIAGYLNSNLIFEKKES